MPEYLTIETPVKLTEGSRAGQEAFELVSLSGHEALSQLFSFTLDLRSERRQIPPEEILGKPVTIGVAAADGQPRFFHGYVNRFVAAESQEGPRRYQAEVVPWLWFLTQTSDCRIFSQKTVPQILEEVFGELGFAVFEKLKPSRSYARWEYCVQYRETDFNFVSRLMEQEGIFYYFKHEKGKHTLVLADSTKAYLPESRELRYQYSFGGEPRPASVTDWAHQYQFVPGKFVQTDYNYDQHPAAGEKQPAKLLESQATGKANPKLFDPDKYEVFDYPGEYQTKDEGKAYTQAYMEQQEAAYDVVEGASLWHNLSPGVKFKLTDHPVPAENKEYVVISIGHSASQSSESQGAGVSYSNTFQCLPASVLFRPARTTAKPGILGVQTAVVVGPPGSEIHTDQYGRVQVQFFWDRYNTRMQPGGDATKQAEPIWIRVGQIMAGKQWGAMFIPRVGQEVIVTFLEGDPDRPLVTGVVYNKDQMPPYNPKEEPTKSYLKTNSSPGGNGYNEIRFEDKAGKEQIFIHAQRDFDLRVNNEYREFVGGERSLIVGSQQAPTHHYEWVHGDKVTTCDDSMGLYTKRNLIVHVGEGGSGYYAAEVEQDHKTRVHGSCELLVDKDRAEKIGGSQSLIIDGDLQQKVGMKHALEAGQEIHLNAGMKVVIEAGMQLTIKGPGGFVDIGPAGVTIQGTLVNINSGGSAGTGSGASPQSPQGFSTPQPPEPHAADSHRSGQKSTPF
ncbi:MAG: type VI secretion system Vgr family protein [Thermoguttaceae bacterium]